MISFLLFYLLIIRKKVAFVHVQIISSGTRLSTVRLKGAGPGDFIVSAFQQVMQTVLCHLLSYRRFLQS